MGVTPQGHVAIALGLVLALVAAACAVDPSESTIESAVVLGGNVDVSNLPGVQFAPGIAIDPTNPNHLLVASGDSSQTTPSRLYETTNAGLTWTMTPGAGGAVAFDGSGTAYVLGGTLVSGPRLERRPIGGSWTSSAAPGGVFAVDDATNALYMASIDGYHRFHLSISHDGGSTFTTTEVPCDEGPDVVGPVAVGPDGTVAISWYNTVTHKLRVSRSTMGGTWFEPATTVATIDAPEGTVILAASTFEPAIAIDIDRSTSWRRGTIYATWVDRVGDFDVFLSSSADGQTWSPRKRVNDDATGRRQDQFGASIAVDEVDGSVNLAWYDTRLDPTNRYATAFTARSSDGGQTLINTQAASRTPDQNLPVVDWGDVALAARGGAAWPAWTDTRSGNAEIETVDIFAGPDFTLTPSPPSLVTVDSFASYAIATTPEYGFAGPIALSIVSAPAALRTAWQASSVRAGDSTALYVWPGSLAPGDYTITIAVVGGGVHHLLPLALHVADFQIALDPEAGETTIVRHPDGTVTPGVADVIASGLGGFTSDVTLSAVSLPIGCSANISPVVVHLGLASGISVTCDATAPHGNVTLTFAATGGGRTHAFTVPAKIYDDLIAANQWSSRAADVEPGDVVFYGGGEIAQPVAVPNDVASAKLSFTLTGMSQPDGLSVVVRTGSGESTVTTLYGSWLMGYGTLLVHESVDLAAWRGQTIYVELVSSASITGETFYLQDIQLRVGP